MTLDHSLTRLIVVIMVLNGAHTVDHIIRGDFHWLLDAQPLGFVAGVTGLYLVLEIGLRFSRSGVVGPPFRTISGCAGLVIGWCSHFSPVTDQPVQVISGVYHTTAG